MNQKIEKIYRSEVRLASYHSEARLVSSNANMSIKCFGTSAKLYHSELGVASLTKNMNIKFFVKSRTLGSIADESTRKKIQFD